MFVIDLLDQPMQKFPGVDVGAIAAYAQMQVFAGCTACASGHADGISRGKRLSPFHGNVRKMAVNTHYLAVVYAHEIAQVPVVAGLGDRSVHDAAHHLPLGGKVDAVVEVGHTCYRMPAPAEAGSDPVIVQWQADGRCR